MLRDKNTRALLACLLTMSGISDHVCAEPNKSKANRPSTAETFAFVPSDDLLKQVGQTRAQWNAKLPRSEREWRAAWAAKGTSRDNNLYKSIRSQSAAPKDNLGKAN